jgi:subtilisin family serine protease
MFIRSRKRQPNLHILAAATAVALSSMSVSPVIAGEINSSGLQSAATHDRFIVKYRAGSDKGANLAIAKGALSGNIAVGGRLLSLGHLRRLAVGADVVQVNRKLDHAEAISLMRQIAADPNVEYVEVDAIMHPAMTPNDTRYGEQWHYFEASGGLNLPSAWNKATGTGSVVAVIDSGITNHSDLNQNVITGYDFISDPVVAGDGDGRDANPSDPGNYTVGSGCGVPPCTYPDANSSWHGTHVAGTIAAVTNNAKGVAGVAFNARISPVRVLGRGGGSLSDVSDAIVWASGGNVSGVPANTSPAEVINLSLQAPGTCSASLQTAINGAVSRGATVVVAAGNSNTDVANVQPASCNNVIAVAANDRQGNRASYSNFGTKVDVTAPGGETATAANGVLSTLNTGTTGPAAESYAFNEGTSMAAPHVAGVVALMQSISVQTPAAVESQLKSTARALPGSCSGGCGAGIVDAYAAVSPLTSSIVLPTNVGADFDGDGSFDILWRNSSNGQNAIWRSGNSATQQPISTVYSQAWKVVGVGDFNGDLDDDILWRHGSTGENAIWKSGNSATQQAVTTVDNFDWQVSGVGDFDGDSNDDILWRNTSTGANSIWRSGNAATQRAVTAVDNLDWKVVGIGDFDGDNQDDILWRNTSDGANSIWRSGNSAAPRAVTLVGSQAWQVVGVGDFNGDNIDDILWRNSSTGANTIWKSGNDATQQAVTAVTNFDWQVVGVGDFNGDNKDDILWRNGNTGANTIWKSGNSATLQAVTTVDSQAWEVVP